MCLAIPGKVVGIGDEGGLRMGRVDFGGVVKRVCLDYVPDLEVGDYTIVHVGFALSKIDEQEAMRTLAVFEQMGVLEDEFAEGDEAFARAASVPQSACPDRSCQSQLVSQRASAKRTEDGSCLPERRRRD